MGVGKSALLAALDTTGDGDGGGAGSAPKYKKPVYQYFTGI